jgi:paraquat-inducible protein A
MSAVREARIFECHDCGLRCELGALSSLRTVRCRRCGATLLSVAPNSLDRALALTVTGLVLVAVADTMPFMSLNIQGRVQHASLLTGAVTLIEGGFWPLGWLVLLTTVIVPLAKLGGLAYVLVGLRFPRPPRDLPLVFRWIEILHPWSMIEVYLLGVFVAYVKLIALATIDIGASCLALAAVMPVMVAIDATLCPELVWRRMEDRGLVKGAGKHPGSPPVLCETCGLVAPLDRHGSPCPRCGVHRHWRKPDSITRTWALVLTALILYIPANVFPVMTVISFGKGAPDTILSGVEELFLAGMWPLALLVFFASITVPVLKILSLIFLLTATQRRSRWRLRDRTLLYRIVESIGRWSMIDIFMISILVGLVNLGAIATIETGVGAISFAGVVIITMFAASAFDPRLMWDQAGENL